MLKLVQRQYAVLFGRLAKHNDEVRRVASQPLECLRMAFPRLVKHCAQLVLPRSFYERIQAVRSRRYQVRQLAALGILEQGKRYIERHGTVVRHGPFTGLVYPLDAALSRHCFPKLLGTYEMELHQVIDRIAGRSYDCVIDIGSAEGYYAVGLARLLRVPVLAFDPEPTEKSLCAFMARLNGVSDYVRLRDLFLPDQIPEFRSQRVLLVSDCEGFEQQLFTAHTVGYTAKWDLLIELHADAVNILPSLNWPHDVTLIESTPRDELTYPELEGIGRPDVLLSEYRGERARWLWCDSSLSA